MKNVADQNQHNIVSSSGSGAANGFYSSSNDPNGGRGGAYQAQNSNIKNRPVQ